MADMVELFLIAPNDSIWAICAEGRLLHAEPGEWHWRSVLAPATAHIRVLSVSFVTTG
jgi:predicted membrane protein